MSGKDYISQIFLTESLQNITAARRLALIRRDQLFDSATATSVRSILDDVAKLGDSALKELALRLDGVALKSLEIPRKRWIAALDSIDSALISAINRAIRNIESVQRPSLPVPITVSPEAGIVITRQPIALDRVGVYAPGGRAAYPSSVLMGAVPARVAGVGDVVLCSPPGPDGSPSAVVLAAAELAGVDRVFAIGGAGAVAAMAYGTETVPRVDRIVGPGNAYVAAAKLQVASLVGIDSPAGPSELLVIADASTNPEVVAREILAQAEHDPEAIVIVVAIGEEVAIAITERVMATLPGQQRRDTIETALTSRGAFLWTSDVESAIEFSNDFAPEHLLLAVKDAPSLLPRLRAAGTIFVGESSSVSFGDYMTGANHVLPTGGLARSYSGLSVLDFVRFTTYQQVDPGAAASLASDVGTFADAEGLFAHAATARQWGTHERSRS
ncbi:MAG: histidinol dehydrogenase [Gemmatimonadaceae bacterium]